MSLIVSLAPRSRPVRSSRREPMRRIAVPMGTRPAQARTDRAGAGGPRWAPPGRRSFGPGGQPTHPLRREADLCRDLDRRQELARGGPPAVSTRPDVRALALTHEPVRLTRRARLLVTFSALAVAGVITASPAAAPAVGATDHSTTVRAGQTLSEVAARELPGVALARAVLLIQLANNLSSDQVHAGQLLEIPTTP